MAETSIEGKAREKAHKVPKRGHRWTREEALAAAEKAKLSPNHGRPSSDLNARADELAERVMTEVVALLDNPKASKVDRRNALQLAVKMVARRITQRTEADVTVLTPEAERAWQEFGEELTPEQAAKLGRLGLILN